MRRTIYVCILILVVLLFFILGCSKSEYPLSQDINEIIRIEIVEIDSYKIISTGNYDMIKTRAVIDPDTYGTFFSRFYKLNCKKSVGPSPECVEGIAILFTYKDGAFEIVGAECSYYYTADKKASYPLYYFELDEFTDFALAQIE